MEPGARRRVLVLGATGHVGQAVTRAMLAHGHRVTVASRQRRPEPLADLFGLVDVVTGDLDRGAPLDDWLRGHDVVVDAAAPYPLHLFVGAHAALFAQARRRTLALTDAARRHGATLAFVSSFTTLPRADERGLAPFEARLRRAAHPYFALKAMMESLVLDASARGLRALVVNPASCLGPWDSKPDATSLVGNILTGRFAFTVSDRVVNVLDVRDLAACVRVAIDRGPFGEALPLAGHDVRFGELTVRIARAAGVAPPVFQVPSRFGTLASLSIETAWAFAGAASPMPTLGGMLIADNLPMRPSAAQRALGVALRPLDDSVRDAVAWRVANFRPPRA